jgi:hypothetical protein
VETGQHTGTATLERPVETMSEEAPASATRQETLDWLRELWRTDWFRVPLVIFALSRAYVFLLGAIAMWIDVTLPAVPALGFYMPELYGPAHYLLQPWRNWDGHWFTLVATRGYSLDKATTAFFPLYPLLLHWVSWFLDDRIELAGVLISNLTFLGALIVFYRLVALDFSAAVARRTLVCLALFPVSFYFNAVYSESLFLLLAVGCFYAARRDRWWLAGVLGCLAALTRSHGVLLAIPLGLLFLKQQGWRPRQWHANPVSILLVPFGMMGYVAYLRRIWNDPLVMVHAQKGWDRYSANPIQTMQAGVKAVNGCAVRDWNAGVNFCWANQIVQHPGLATLRDVHWRWGLSESNFVELAATLVLFALGIAALRYLPLTYSSFLAAGIILPLWSPSSVHPLMSMIRFTLILFPAFIVLGMITRRRPVYVAIVTIFAILLAFFTIQFASWLWVA